MSEYKYDDKVWYKNKNTTKPSPVRQRVSIIVLPIMIKVIISPSSTNIYHNCDFVELRVYLRVTSHTVVELNRIITPSRCLKCVWIWKHIHIANWIHKTQQLTFTLLVWDEIKSSAFCCWNPRGFYSRSFTVHRWCDMMFR